MYRQGDVMLIPSEVEPNSFDEVVAMSEKVVAEGEDTGHRHLLTGDLVSWDDASGDYVRALAEAVLTHEEHSTLTIPPGTYEVRRQRVYAPADDPWMQTRWVAD
jgi:hypothetical protein